MRVPASTLAAVAGVVLLATPAAAAAQDSALRAPATVAGRLLDVPFLPQTEDLCGGAAVAMVLRYWGDGARPDDFAALVDRTRAGIAADVLAADVRRRGWTSLPFQGAPGRAGLDEMRGHVDAGRPVVALIAVGPDRYHYVVVVAVTDDALVVHDPAQAPFRVLPAAAFDEAWAASGRWALMVLPSDQGPGTGDRGRGQRSEPDAAPASEAPAAAAALERPASTDACTPWVDDLVAQANGGDLSGAGRGLEAAATVCPQSAGVWRELAGVRFLQQRWTDAAALARRATALDTADDDGWDLLATSLFLDGRRDEALEAWNHLDRPQVDVVRVSGAKRTRQPVIAGLVGLEPRSTVTPTALARAARRLDALPSALTTSLRYQPIEGGLATIEAAVVERPVVPRGLVPVAALAAQAAIQREARLSIASPAGQGERWSAAWRWWEQRPRVAFALALPMVAGWPGITTIDGLWERATYATPRGRASTTQLERHRAGLQVSDWASGRLRWSAGVALDRWDTQRYGNAEAGVDLRLAADRIAVAGTIGGWAASGPGSGFGRLSLEVAARSRASVDTAAWHVLAGATGVSPAAPFDLWPGAGLGLARAPLLRAHPLLDDGVVTGQVFGQRLLHGTVEYRRPLRSTAAGQIAMAAFSDTARAWRTVAGEAAWHSDAGIGLRVSLPADAGTLRLDLARGLRDGRHVLSAGWNTSWPDR